MSPVEMFKIVTEKGSYVIGYILDGWTRTIEIEAKSPGEAMVYTQNILGSICDVTFVERSL